MAALPLLQSAMAALPPFNSPKIIPPSSNSLQFRPPIASAIPKFPAPDSTLTRRDVFGLAAGLNAFLLLRNAAPAMAEEGPCSFSLSPSGLAFCDKVVGAGEAAAKGQLIKAHYVGKLEDGKVFDSSYSRGKPLTFRIGVGEVIKGWDQGILGDEGVPPMLSGGKRTLKIPPELGYGARGAGCRGGSCVIPPGATLLFEVEFLGKA
ncbi:peptidyl-prolyl cis-trans isomerase FKBP13, chloroplastic-like [Wolffia australiana]